MKKLFILPILLLLLITRFKAIGNNENIYHLEFDSFNSKNIYDLLKDTDSMIVNIEVKVNHKYKTYSFLYNDIKNIEKDLLTKISKDINDTELLLYYEINGINVKSIDIRCTSNSYILITERLLNYE